MSQRAVIVGAGQAGHQVASSLIIGGYPGEIVLIGKEPCTPYQRPPLSKQVLKDGWAFEKCQLRQQGVLDSGGIEFRPGVSATGLDPERQCVTLDDESSLEYDDLVICTGSRLNRIGWAETDLSGIHYLRTIDHALALRGELASGCHLVIIGAGYIGLEVAASARTLGCNVSVIEAQDHIMKRSALEPIADFLLARHREQGVDIHLNRQVATIDGKRRIEAVTLDDGSRLPADVVLVGIGVRPQLDWLKGSGIAYGRGIKVDTHCRTSIPRVLAAGDCTETGHPLFAGSLVLESVQNAISQGKVAAATVLGADTEYTDVPWFWSEQFEHRFQMAGVPQQGDEFVVRKLDESSVSVLSLGADRLNAIQCVNEPGDFMCGRKLIARPDEFAADSLRDASTDLRKLLS